MTRPDAEYKTFINKSILQLLPSSHYSKYLKAEARCSNPVFLRGFPARVVEHHLASFADESALCVEGFVGFGAVDHCLCELASLFLALGLGARHTL